MISEFLAKESAEVCIDMMIEESNDYTLYKGRDSVANNKEYWNQVKAELSKL